MNCSNSITFPEIWLEIFRQIEKATDSKELIVLLPEHNPTSEDIRNILAKVSRPSIIVIDEYDRVDESVAVGMADTINPAYERPHIG